MSAFEAWLIANHESSQARQIERFRSALLKIASLNEGSVVDEGFDSPGPAQTAREALSAEWIGPCVHGRDPWDRCDTCVDDGEVTAWAKAARVGK